jgi:hypothetical protein
MLHASLIPKASVVCARSDQLNELQEPHSRRQQQQHTEQTRIDKIKGLLSFRGFLFLFIQLQYVSFLGISLISLENILHRNSRSASCAYELLDYYLCRQATCMNSNSDIREPCCGNAGICGTC